jgi:predicted N-acetyltransferase YhbS
VQARPLFEFAALPWPAGRDIAFAWGAVTAADSAERLIGAVIVERSGGAMMLHGPVVTAGEAPMEIAAQLVAAALDHATAAGATTVFTRPQGLDRVWVRFGFIPVPESTLPGGLGDGGAGLFAWRGGSALWTLRRNATA